jgi:hypothetical protein
LLGHITSRPQVNFISLPLPGPIISSRAPVILTVVIDPSSLSTLIVLVFGV